MNKKRIGALLILFLVMGFLISCGNSAEKKDAKEEKKNKILELNELLDGGDKVAAEEEMATTKSVLVISINDNIATLSVENDTEDGVILSAWYNALEIDKDTELFVKGYEDIVLHGEIQANGSVKWDYDKIKKNESAENDKLNEDEEKATPTEVPVTPAHITEESANDDEEKTVKEYDYPVALPMQHFKCDDVMLERAKEILTDEDEQELAEYILVIDDMMKAAEKVGAEEEDISKKVSFCIDCRINEIQTAMFGNSDSPEINEIAYKSWVEIIGYDKYDIDSGFLNVLEGRIYGELDPATGAVTWRGIGTAFELMCYCSESFSNLFVHD